MRAPSIGRRTATDQKRKRVWGNGRKPARRLVAAAAAGLKMVPVRAASTWATRISRAGAFRLPPRETTF